MSHKSYLPYSVLLNYHSQHRKTTKYYSDNEVCYMVFNGSLLCSLNILNPQSNGSFIPLSLDYSLYYENKSTANHTILIPCIIIITIPNITHLHV